MNTTRPSMPARSAVLPQRQPVVRPAAPRQPFQVLQSGRAPAQLSLFLRPALNAR